MTGLWPVGCMLDGGGRSTAPRTIEPDLLSHPIALVVWYSGSSPKISKISAARIASPDSKSPFCPVLFENVLRKLKKKYHVSPDLVEWEQTNRSTSPMKQRHRTSGNGSTVSCRALDERNASAGQAAGSLPPATGRLRAELVAGRP